MATPALRDDDTGTAAVAPVRRSAPIKLAVGAIGVVFGDIGTSPIYALKISFIGHHRLPVDMLHIYGVISLIFWTMLVIVTIKYVLVIMRADNHGEGGSFALLALITRLTGQRRWSSGLVMLGVLAAALFYGDSIITPAISVLSAVEGLTVVNRHLAPTVVPIAVIILVGLFAVQKNGTALMYRLFGPIMLVYFTVVALLGLASIVHQPEVVMALSPQWIVAFVADDPVKAFLALGSVVLAVTGVEALYADIGYFGRRPIAIAWLYSVFPCLLLNYLGQCSLLLRHPEAVDGLFFNLAPAAWRLPLVVLATMATVIASQAVISGAFSVTRQAIQLGFMPRMRIAHASASHGSQIYMPFVNTLLMVATLLLVVSFGASTRLAAAYGIAVTGTMTITTVMMVVLLLRIWHVKYWLAVPLLLVLMTVDLIFFASNLTKILVGGWVPLVIGLIIFTLLTTWSKGRSLMRAAMADGALPLEVFAKSAHASAQRAPGTAVFMCSASAGVPSALLHNMKHNGILHERIIVLTVQIDEVPFVSSERCAEVEEIGWGFYRAVLHFGYLDETDVPAALACMAIGLEKFNPMKTSFFLSRQTLIPAAKPAMALWRERIFDWMLRNATGAMEFFRLPTNRVVELGSQVEI